MIYKSRNYFNLIFQADDLELQQNIRKIQQECAAKTNFSEENIKKVAAHDLEETENIRCFQKCFFEGAGIVNDKGIDAERILTIAKLFKKDEVKTKANLDKCSKLYKADNFDCDAAFEMYECFHEW